MSMYFRDGHRNGYYYRPNKQYLPYHMQLIQQFPIKCLTEDFVTGVVLTK